MASKMPDPNEIYASQIPGRRGRAGVVVSGHTLVEVVDRYLRELDNPAPDYGQRVMYRKWMRELLDNAEGERSELLERAWALVHAQGRMLDGWAEGDDAVKQHLWSDLHRKGDKLRETLEMVDPEGRRWQRARAVGRTAQQEQQA